MTTGNRNKNISISVSSFKIKFQSLPFFTWVVTDLDSLLTGHTKNSKLNGCNMKRRTKIMYSPIMEEMV